jgi:hypothetical protein
MKAEALFYASVTRRGLVSSPMKDSAHVVSDFLIPLLNSMMPLNQLIVLQNRQVCCIQ